MTCICSRSLADKRVSLGRPLLHEDQALNLCLVHAGLAPQWDIATARSCAREFEQALRKNPERLFEQMYGDEPNRWDDRLAGAERLRFIVNCFTRLRYVDAHGRLALRAKGSPKKAHTKSLVPWFAGGVRPLVHLGIFQQFQRDQPRHGMRLGRKSHGAQARRPWRRTRARQLQGVQGALAFRWPPGFPGGSGLKISPLTKKRLPLS